MKLISYNVYNNPNSDIVSYLIAIASCGRYSHSELLFSNNLSLNIDFGKPAQWVVRRDLDDKEWSITPLYVTSEEEERLFKYIDENIIGKEYDLGGALLSIFKICLLEDRDKVFCSEAIGDLLGTTESYRCLSKGCKYSPVGLHNHIKRINKKLEKFSEEKLAN